MLPKAALVRSRKAIESLYADTCRIITEKDTVDPDTGIVKTVRVASAEYPCRIYNSRIRIYSILFCNNSACIRIQAFNCFS